MTPRKALNVTRTLEKELERETSLSPKPKKKSNQEPSLFLLAKTRSSSKLNLGVKSRPRGRRHASQVREDEMKRCLANGSQRTLLECSPSTK